MYFERFMEQSFFAFCRFLGGFRRHNNLLLLKRLLGFLWIRLFEISFLGLMRGLAEELARGSHVFNTPILRSLRDGLVSHNCSRVGTEG